MATSRLLRVEHSSKIVLEDWIRWRPRCDAATHGGKTEGLPLATRPAVMIAADSNSCQLFNVASKVPPADGILEQALEDAALAQYCSRVRVCSFSHLHYSYRLAVVKSKSIKMLDLRNRSQPAELKPVQGIWRALFSKSTGRGQESAATVFQWSE